MRAVCILATAIALSALPARAQPAQPPQDSPDAVRQMVADARRDIEKYQASGATAGTEDPVLKWDRSLWEVHLRTPGTEAGALAAVEAIRLLTQANVRDRSEARIDSLGTDDAAWERLPSVIYTDGIARNDLSAVISRLSRVAGSTTSPTIKAAALVTIGRAYRRTGDRGAATRALEDAKAAAPNTRYADEASGLIYEIAHLSPGLPAPPISAKARDGRKISLSTFHGTPVVLVFWGTT